MLRFKFICVYFILLSLRAFSAPCCGGNQGQTSMITGDQKGIVSFHTLYSQVIMDALSDGTYLNRNAETKEYQFSFLLDGSWMMTDRFQLGLRFPLLIRHVEFDSSPNQVGMGDVLVQGTWEAIRELRYSPWKPRVFLFTQITVPLGTSAFETNRPASSFGRGFWMGDLGATVLKQWNVVDASFTTEVHQGLPKTVSLSGVGDVSATPGVGSSVSGSFGIRLGKKVHLGLTESFVYESGVSFDASNVSSDAQRFWSSSVQATFLINDLWAVRGVYTDQTLLGSARNVALSRFVGLTFQRSFLR